MEFNLRHLFFFERNLLFAVRVLVAGHALQKAPF